MKSTSKWPVALYVPNIIGYLRIILSVIAFANYEKPNIFFIYYFVGFVLDAADGLAARKLQQSSEFGAQLDMLTDRCATAALLTVLAKLYPAYAWLCFSLVMLDGYSHWMQMVAGMATDSSSHKTSTRGWLLKMYYWRPCLTFVCSMNEMCFLMLYMKAFMIGPVLFGSVTFFDAAIYCSAPICILKQIISVRQVASAHVTIADSA